MNTNVPSGYSKPLERLLGVMARLRNRETGCAWDLAQNFRTIAPYTIEEAYEVADAIERDDMADLCSELGDLLFQVVFHARMAEEAGHFTFAEVAATIADKMEARHPHIFAGDRGAMTDQRWEDLKAAERAAEGSKSAMDGVAHALPALKRAQKLQQRAARDGFDWPDLEGPEGKLIEEMEELRSATTDQIFEEAGDLMFAAVNLVRGYGVDAEEALRCGNAKFERRYRAMESKSGGTIAGLSLKDQERLWQDVKAAERS